MASEHIRLVDETEASGAHSSGVSSREKRLRIILGTLLTISVISLIGVSIALGIQSNTQRQDVTQQQVLFPSPLPLLFCGHFAPMKNSRIFTHFHLYSIASPFSYRSIHLFLLERIEKFSKRRTTFAVST